MHINSHSVHFTTEEAFQLLHDQDLRLWEQVIDLLADTADELYSRTPVDSREGDWVTGDGIEFDGEGVFWSNKDLPPSSKWEEIAGEE